MQGKSKIELDSNAVNILLKEFASKDGTYVSYQGGLIQVDREGLRIRVTELPLKETKLQMQGSFGTVNLELSDFKLEPNSITLDLDIGVDS